MAEREGGEVMDYYERELLAALKKRGHSDDSISEMSPELKFIEYCNWNGLINWGETLIQTWKAAQATKS